MSDRPRFAGALRAALILAPPYDTALRLTLILLMVYGPAERAMGVRLLCVTMLVFPGVLRLQYLWWALVWFTVFANASVWYAIDNHQYLIMYWTATCALSVGCKDDSARRIALQRSAQALVAVVFVFAALWKVIGGEYADGSFLHFTFLMDERFRHIAASASGLSPDSLALGVAAVDFVVQNNVLAATVPLPTSERLRVATLALSWSGVIVEGTIGLLHALGANRFYAIRHALYWVFVALTYFLFPVMGFAFVLMILGYAQCAEGDDRRRFSYVLLLGVVHLTLLPWQRLLPV